MSQFEATDENTRDRCGVVRVARDQVIAAPRNQLVRRSLHAMNGSVLANRYRVLRTLGVGGMGAVFEALDLVTKSTVALKALPPGTYNTNQLKRLRREATTATTVHSEHVCRVHHLGVERGTPFIVMDRLHGETLRARLENGPLPIGEAVSIMCQLLDALTATHEAGVIHRDVKPSNVFLTQTSTGAPHVKLIDFGLAKLAQPSSTDGEPSSSSSVANGEEITCSGVVTGTLSYLAPEQLLAVSTVDERVDVYAAAVTFFEMLVGHRPFQGASFAQVVSEIVLGDPPRITDSRSDLPPIFDDLFSMALAKVRERRFASAKAFKRALVASWQSAFGTSITTPAESGICPAMREQDQNQDGASDAYAASGDDEATDLPTLRPPPFVSVSATECRYEDVEEDEHPTLRPPSSAVRMLSGDHEEIGGDEAPTLRPPSSPSLEGR